MAYELISAADYENLPEDNEDCFVELEAICRRNMTRMIDENTTGEFDANVQTQYMATIAAAAAECGIPNIMMSNTGDIRDRYINFAVAVQGEVARIRIRNRRRIQTFSVQLAPNTRAKIEHQISLLRQMIEASDLPPGRKKVLVAKLDELIVELANRRISFAKTMVILSCVVAGLSGATTIAAEGPAAITNIMRWIGNDKETEDAAILRLAPPVKALPAPPVTTATSSNQRNSWDAPNGDLNDEIPF